MRDSIFKWCLNWKGLLSRIVFEKWKRRSNEVFFTTPESSLNYSRFDVLRKKAITYLESVAKDGDIVLEVQSQTLLFVLIWACLDCGRNLILAPSGLSEELLAGLGNKVVSDTRHSKIGSIFVSANLIEDCYFETCSTAELAASCNIHFLSSGTTGKQKLIKNSTGQIIEALSAIRKYGVLERIKGNTAFVSSALVHSYGLFACLEHLMIGNNVVMGCTASFSGALNAIATLSISRNITLIEGVPYFYRFLSIVAKKFKFEKLRHLAIGGDIVHAGDIEKFVEEYAKLTFSVRYGISEIPSFVSYGFFSQYDPKIFKSSSCPLGIYKVQIIDSTLDNDASGEIVIKLPNGESVVTGDIGGINGAAELTIMGRKSYLTKIRGIKVNVLAVENFIRDHFKIDACRVTPMEDRLIIELQSEGYFRPDTFIRELRQRMFLPFGIEARVLAEISRTLSGKLIRLK